MTKNYDVIIIGGGHNSLVCANILAKKNKKVLICEARDTCGGLAKKLYLTPLIEKLIL